MHIVSTALHNSNVVNYIQYDRFPKIPSLNINAVNKERCKINSITKEEQRNVLELDIGDTPEKLKGECLDVYEGIQSEILSSTRFDENIDLSTTCSKWFLVWRKCFPSNFSTHKMCVGKYFPLQFWIFVYGW